MTSPSTVKNISEIISWAKPVTGLNLSDHYAEELRTHLTSLIQTIEEECRRLRKDIAPNTNRFTKQWVAGHDTALEDILTILNKIKE